MKIKLVLHRNNAEQIAVVVTADSTATVEDVAGALSGPACPPAATLAVAAPTAGVGGEPRMLDPTLLLAEAPIGSGFDVAVVEATPDAYRGGPVVAILRVLNGVEEGRAIPLTCGSIILGRTSAAEIQLDDPMVSRRHARIEAGESGVEVVDLNSANGIVVDGESCARVRMIPGQVILVGCTQLTCEYVPQDAGLPSVVERGGFLLFNRSPQVEVRCAGEELRPPAIPAAPAPRAIPWPMVIAPVLMGMAMFAMTHRAASLLIVAMAPVMMLGNLWGQRAQQRKKAAADIETFERQFDALERHVAEGQRVERERRRAEAPATSTVFGHALTLGPLLWTRRPEHWNFLGIRLGVGTAPSRLTVHQSREENGLPAYAERIQELRDRYAWVDGVPLAESLPSCGAVGIAGSRHGAADAVRGMGVNIFGLHSPGEVVAAALTSPDWADDLSWMRWLPHASSPQSPIGELALADNQTAGEALLTALEEEIARRSQPPVPRGPLATADTAMFAGAKVGERADSGPPTVPGAAVVLIVTEDAPVDRPRLTRVIEHGPDVGIYTIFVGSTVASLPAACRTYIDVSRGLDRANIGYVRAGERYEDVAVEGVSLANAELFARLLAPVVDAGAVAPDSSDLPESVALLRLLGHEMSDDVGAVIERWHHNHSMINRLPSPRSQLSGPFGLKAFVGQASPDALALDLRAQGPHALVGGTTGSGKSEFLQAWVLGLAAEYSPDRVTFLFIDYKGGSAFAACRDLPHRVGLVTDLSPHLVLRALTSLRAELRYRERLFERRRAKDLIDMERRQDPETPPALVIVIDEFAALVSDVPEFIDGVVDIAQRGRSLGIHLIMATQRPAGVIKDNLRANTNLRVALRMADEADSKDVVGSAIAANFDPALPGRGVVKVGPGRLIPFQTGYAGGWTTRLPDRARVTVADLRCGAARVWESARVASTTLDGELPGQHGPNDQRRLVDNLRAAAALAEIRAPRRPWLDELADAIDLAGLPLRGDAHIPLGIADIPERQEQVPAFFEPDTDGHLLVYGTSGAGKSTTLRSIAIAAGSRPAEGGAWVYAIDCGTGALRSLEDMPHVGSVVVGDDVERIQRLLRMFRSAVDERGALFSAAHASTLAEYREITGDRTLPRMFLVVDGLGTFRQEWEVVAARSAYYAIFLRLLTEGRPLGVHVVASVDRFGAVPTAVTANMPTRVVLRMSDEGAYAMLGIPKDVLHEGSAPGRAVINGWETHIVTAGGTSVAAEQIAAAADLARRFREEGCTEAPPIGALPADIGPGALPETVDGLPVIGLSETALEPRGFEARGTFMVAGPPRSGKTTALRAIIHGVERAGMPLELFHIGGRRNSLAMFRRWRGAAYSVEQVRDLAAELAKKVAEERSGVRIVVVLENIADFADTDAERALRTLMQAINRSDHLLIADSDTTQLTGGFGLVGELKAGRRGLALRPDTHDGEALFKMAFPRMNRHEFPPGRAILVDNGQHEIVQVAHVSDISETSFRAG